MLDLPTLTTLVNLLSLAISLWLGFYIVTRSPRSRVSWLAALTLWSLMGFFLHNALAINLPGSTALPWLRRVVIIALAFWLHLTVLLMPAREGPRAQTPLSLASRFAVPLAYSLAIVLLAVGIITRGLLSEKDTGPAIYTSGRMPGPFYSLFMLYLLLMGSLAALNLWQGRQQAHAAVLKSRFTTLLVATGLAGLGAVYTGAGIWLRLDLPTFPGDVALAAGMGLLGYAVTRYNALLEGRAVERDFLYTVLAVGSLTAFYVSVALILYLGGHISFLTLILTMMVSISFNSLFDVVRTTLDRVFYHEQFRQLRANLRALAREAGTGRTLHDQLQAILNALCRTLGIRKGFIALQRENTFVVEATQGAHPPGQSLPLQDLAATEIVDLPRPDSHGPEDMRLLVPLYAGGTQVGALVLGPKELNAPYSEKDLELLDDLADQVSGVIHTWRLQADNARAINDMVASFRDRERDLQLQVQQMLAERKEEAKPVQERIDEEEFVHLVEDALRRLHDFPHLGEHALAKLQVVESQLKKQKDGFVTYIDRGKALHHVLLQALQKLRPEGPEPRSQSVPPRGWHQFIILHDSYVLGKLNRDIMSKLYISEGTFNRTRRRALRGVAKALQEMETLNVKS